MTTHPKDILASKIAHLAHLETIAEAVTQEQQAKVAAIVSATAQAIAPTERKIEALRGEIETFAKAHRLDLYGKSKTLDMGTHVLAFRASEVVECDNEKEVAAQLQSAAEDAEEDEAQRLAAAACLRFDPPKLDKTFVRKNWRRYHAWFAGFGFRMVKKEGFNVTPKKLPEPANA